MELYQLRQFQAAAKHKNMTRAAAELCIAQPALSKTIHKLEEEFGSQLFIRNKKGLECTRQGEILLHYADKILSLSDDASRAINESLGETGEIRLCLRSSAVLVSNVLKDFIHEHPHVSFSISSETKGCDLLIDSVSSAFNIPDDAHLLMTEEICLAVSSSHPLAHTGHISIEQMMNEKFIDLANSPSYTGVFNSIFNQCKRTPEIAYSCNDYILQGKLISLGLGVSFVASVTWTSSSLPENICLLHIDDCPHFRSIYYQPLGSFRSDNQRIFEHQLEEYFKKLQS
mgnify:CR=1 FL=1